MLAEPTSSWSNRAIIATWSAGAAATSADVAAQHDTRLSSRPLASSERSAPSTAAGCTSYRHSSHHAGDVARRPRSASHSRERGRQRRRPHRRQVGLAVEHEAALVDVAVEVDGQLRDAGDRLGDVDEHVGAVGEHEPAGDAEVAVEPAVEQHAAVDLDAELAPAGAAAVGVGLDAQAGRVGVGADDAHRERAAARRAPPGDERAAAPDVPGGGDVGPRRALVERGEAGRLERGGRRAHGVPRRRRGVEVGAQAGGRDRRPGRQPWRRCPPVDDRGGRAGRPSSD